MEVEAIGLCFSQPRETPLRIGGVRLLPFPARVYHLIHTWGKGQTKSGTQRGS